MPRCVVADRGGTVRAEQPGSDRARLQPAVHAEGHPADRPVQASRIAVTRCGTAHSIAAYPAAPLGERATLTSNQIARLLAGAGLGGGCCRKTCRGHCCRGGWTGKRTRRNAVAARHGAQLLAKQSIQVVSMLKAQHRQSRVQFAAQLVQRRPLLGRATAIATRKARRPCRRWRSERPYPTRRRRRSGSASGQRARSPNAPCLPGRCPERNRTPGCR